MKKIIVFSLISLLGIFSSCSNDDSPDLGSDEPVVGKDIFFKSPEGIVTTGTANRVTVSFEFAIGRKSRDCSGFGICKLTTFGISVVSKPNSNIAYAEADLEQKMAILELASEFNGSKLDVILRIDEDIIDEEGLYKLKSGSYKLDMSVGQYGGYKIPFEIL